jgi:hypothetical protein
MGGQIGSLQEATNDQVKHSDLREAWSIVIKIKRDAQGKVLSFLGFPSTGLKVFIGRPGYRIDSRTIKRAFGWVTWSHRLRELNPLNTLLLPNFLLICISLCEVLELIVIFPTSPSSLKMEFVCILYCVFLVWRFYRFFLKGRFHLSLFDIFSLTTSWPLWSPLYISFS